MGFGSSASGLFVKVIIIENDGEVIPEYRAAIVFGFITSPILEERQG